MEELVEQTGGLSGADLVALCREAALHKIRSNMDLLDPNEDHMDTGVLTSLTISMEHFAAALTSRRGSRPTSRVHR